jgi:serine/threonine protein kinase/outer membrane protein assembly factor BamB
MWGPEIAAFADSRVRPPAAGAAGYAFAPEEEWMTSDSARQAYGSFGWLGPGSRIAGHLIEEQIGAGGMATVYRARDEVLNRLAALKVIAPSMADDEEFRARFLRESQAAAAVESPHIVPVYGAGEDKGLLYITTRFMPDGDLAGLVRRCGGRLAADRAVSFISQVASALDAAHAAGLVHRDVKLANILVEILPGSPERAYLSDFGLSKGMSSTGLTAPGQFLGTPDYSAPEQIRGAHVDGRADQYALACVAFTLLTGTPPFRRQGAVATLFAHLQESVPLVTGLRSDLPAAVDGIIARALAKSPADRYSRCGEFAAALREALSPARPSAASGCWDQPPHTTDNPAATGESTGHASTITVGNGSAGHSGGTPGQDRGRGRGKARVVWAAGTAAVLAAGIAATVVLHAPSSKPGSAGDSPPRTTPSAAPSKGTGGAPSSALDTSNCIAPGAPATGGCGFKDPTGIAVEGTHIWIANHKGRSVTELNASNGHLVQVLSDHKYGFSGPYGIAVDRAHIWVANFNGNSVTELNASNGHLVQVLSDHKYGFSNPYGIADDGTHIWVTNSRGNSVTELNASNGSLVQVLPASVGHFNEPWGIADDGTHIWVTNFNGNSVTELNASNGSLVQVLPASVGDFSGPWAIADDGTHIWVTNYTGHSVTELNASDGSLVQVLSDHKYGFSYPFSILDDGTHVWVANHEGRSVTELNASDGSLVQVLSAPVGDFNDPWGIADDGTHIWVTNNGSDLVTEMTIG